MIIRFTIDSGSTVRHNVGWCMMFARDVHNSWRNIRSKFTVIWKQIENDSWTLETTQKLINSRWNYARLVGKYTPNKWVTICWLCQTVLRPESIKHEATKFEITVVLTMMNEVLEKWCDVSGPIHHAFRTNWIHWDVDTARNELNLEIK